MRGCALSYVYIDIDIDTDTDTDTDTDISVWTSMLIALFVGRTLLHVVELICMTGTCTQ